MPLKIVIFHRKLLISEVIEFFFCSRCEGGVVCLSGVQTPCPFSCPISLPWSWHLFSLMSNCYICVDWKANKKWLDCHVLILSPALLNFASIPSGPINSRTGYCERQGKSLGCHSVTKSHRTEISSLHLFFTYLQLVLLYCSISCCEWERYCKS